MTTVCGHAAFVSTLDEPDTWQAQLASFAFLSGYAVLAIGGFLLMWSAAFYLGGQSET